MNMKNDGDKYYNICVNVLIAFFYISMVVIILTGCKEKEDTLKPTSSKVQIVERKIIVKCELPEVECEFTGEGFEPTRKLLECIKTQKEAIRICNETLE